jgi:Cyclic nucleotide-binding domain/Major Facilitator Superfamily
MANALRALAATFANPDLRSIQVAWAAFSFANWGYIIALGVYAFDVGGPAAVGVVGFIRLLPAALAAPFAGLLGDRHSRRAVLMASSVAGAAVLGATAIAVYAGAPVGLVFSLAGLFMVVTVAYIPAEAALLPIVARTPQELSAANVAHSVMDNIGFLGGSIATGVLLATTSPEVVFALTAAMAIAAAIALALIRRDERPEYAREMPLSRIAHHTARAFATLLGQPGLRLLAAAATLLAIFEGAADVLVVIIALDLLDIGEGAVGYLNAAWGVGAVLGGAALAVLLHRGKLAAGLVLGSLLLGIATALPAVWPAPSIAAVAWLGIGAGYTFVEIAGHTLMQRLCSDEVLARVFGALEASRVGGLALGSILASGLVALLGTRGALLALAVLLPAFAVLRWGRLRSFESGAPVDERAFSLLRGDAIFAPLPVATLERLARDLLPVDAAEGRPIITQGEKGDRFYVIESGEVEVFEDGSLARTESEGESFGEIALLRDVPRTATVRAVRDTRLLTLERDQFISAVTGLPRSHDEAQAVADFRLGIAGG